MPETASSFSAGAAAGAVTGILTTPFDVLKTRLMTQGANRTYANVGDCAVKIWQEEGWRTFFKVGCSSGHADHCETRLSAYVKTWACCTRVRCIRNLVHVVAGMGAAGAVDLDRSAVLCVPRV